ncbi:MAG: helix-turn-helix transcriptional regulator, partial [Coxiellaceae bacterium]|nr:helix-turn-helix transcriptional regulator [Coxiellaceae bacterium]
MSTVSEVKEISLAKKAKERGRRLKLLRSMTGLSRKLLEQQYHISASTIQSWEDAKAGGLTEKGAKRVIQVFHKEGIQCTLNWLLHGLGQRPQPSSRVFEEGEMSASGEAGVAPVGEPNEDRAIVNELLAFRQNNPKNPVEYIVADNGMGPFYAVGDYIAGKRRFAPHVESALGLDCIVETKENEILFRRVRPGSK